jgi:hypothetical protein
MSKAKNKQRSPSRTVQHPTTRPVERGPRTVWLWLGGALAIAAGLSMLGVLLVRGDDPPVAVDDAGPVHVHGLGINPAGGGLYIATHTGLWRLPPGASVPERLGESRQDTMGFTVVGPDHFLGSGHPDNVDQPPLLGLIESNDGGKSWDSISLLGAADFHVLRADGPRVYGYDVTNNRLMFSRDGGRRWTERQPPAAVLDAHADPSNPDHVVATTEQGLFRSEDAGATWERMGDPIGLLAWPEPGRLYLVTGGGDVLVSASGRAWRRLGTIGGQPAAFMANGDRDLYAALHEGAIVQSRDRGRTWVTITS